jgi:hypothetical protein
MAGTALLALWEQDRSRTHYFDAARRIGDRVTELHIAGSLDHACLPAQLFCPLYRHTGESRYLKAAIRRVQRAVAFQLSTGSWEGEQGQLWYHSMNLGSLIAAYVAIPFTLEHQGRKDRLARSIVAATNWFLVNQHITGAFPLHSNPGNWNWAFLAEREVVSFEGGEFRQAPLAEGYFGHGAFEIDTLVALYEHLDVQDILPALHGYASLIAGTNRLWRLEFNTFGAGRYLGLLSDLQKARRIIDVT